jgi:hypothetical protein
MDPFRSAEQVTTYQFQPPPPPPPKPPDPNDINEFKSAVEDDPNHQGNRAAEA